MKPEQEGNLDLDQAWDLLAQGDLDGAMASAQQLLDANETWPEAHNLVGHIHAQGGNLQAALTAYETAIEFDAGYLEAMLNSAEILLQLGDLSSAIERIDIAVEAALSDDERADALLLKIDALLAVGKVPDAKAAISELPDGPFDSPHLEFLVGRARFEIGDHAAAALAIEQAAAGPAPDPEVFYYLGLVREVQGDVMGSTAAFLQSRDADLDRPRVAWSEAMPLFEKRVQNAIRRLPRPLSDQLDGALVLVDDVPGAEIVSEGADPRMPIWVDDLDLGKGVSLRRAFVYQRNVERMVPGPQLLDEALVRLLTDELQRVFQSA